MSKLAGVLLLDGPPWEERSIRQMMDAAPTVSLSPSDQKRLNNGKKRKVNIIKWQDKVRKESRNAGLPYISKNKKPVPGKLPPEEVS